MKSVSTLMGVKIIHERRSGNTTRQVDKAIEILFSGDICVCEDHVNMGMNYTANDNLFKRILRRLELEHKWSKDRIIIDRNKGIKIQLSDKPISHPRVKLGTGVKMFGQD